METEIRFNLQRYLEDMRREQQDAHKELSSKLETHAERHAALDKRVDRIETSQGRVKWLVGTMIALGGLAVAWFKS